MINKEKQPKYLPLVNMHPGGVLACVYRIDSLCAWKRGRSSLGSTEIAQGGSMVCIRKAEIGNFRSIQTLDWFPLLGVNCLIGPGRQW